MDMKHVESGSAQEISVGSWYCIKYLSVQSYTVKVPYLEHPKISSKMTFFRLLIIFSYRNIFFGMGKFKKAKIVTFLGCFNFRFNVQS